MREENRARNVDERRAAKVSIGRWFSGQAVHKRTVVLPPTAILPTQLLARPFYPREHRRTRDVVTRLTRARDRRVRTCDDRVLPSTRWILTRWAIFRSLARAATASWIKPNKSFDDPLIFQLSLTVLNFVRNFVRTLKEHIFEPSRSSRSPVFTVYCVRWWLFIKWKISTMCNTENKPPESKLRKYL